ncbi:MAG: NAD-binding protein [Treponema sp.]|nr:NAD-binding protein [Treponema sp.]
MSKKSKAKSSAFWRKVRKNVKYSLKNPFTYLFILIVLLLVAATIVVGNTEPYHPEGEVTNWKDAIWHSIVAVVAAYYDYYMKTVPGRLASLVLLLVGMAFWTIVLGKITSAILAVQSKNNKGLKKLKRMKGHFLLCGWRPGFEKILEAVMIQNPDISPDEIVVVNNAPADQMEILRSDSRFTDIKYVAGDFSDADVLKRAFIQTASRALVMADYSTGSDISDMEVDSRTVLSVLTMKNLNAKVYVSAELLSDKFEEHLRMANVDELILTQDYEHSLLATASSGLGYSNVIKALISDDADTGIIIEDIPKNLIGKTYGELVAYYDSDMDDGDVLVGLLLNAGSDRIGNGSINQPLLTPSDDYVIPNYAKAVVVRGRNED